MSEPSDQPTTTSSVPASVRRAQLPSPLRLSAISSPRSPSVDVASEYPDLDPSLVRAAGGDAALAFRLHEAQVSLRRALMAATGSPTAASPMSPKYGHETTGELLSLDTKTHSGVAIRSAVGSSSPELRLQPFENPPARPLLAKSARDISLGASRLDHDIAPKIDAISTDHVEVEENGNIFFASSLLGNDIRPKASRRASAQSKGSGRATTGR